MMVKDIIHDSPRTVSNTFGPYLRDLLLEIEIFLENALTRLIFELEKCSFFKWVRIFPEIYWYHYQGASPAPSRIIRHKH